MAERSSELTFNLVEPSPADVEALRRINAMSDAQLRALRPRRRPSDARGADREHHRPASRSRAYQPLSDQFPGGEAERTDALLQTDHDQVALVEAGAEALRLQTALERADREATDHEVDTGALLLTQMRELVNAVRARIPSGD